MKGRVKRTARSPFRPGRTRACEAHLFEFAGRDLSGDNEQSVETTEQVAANSIADGLAYLRRWQSNFEVRSVRWLGLITMVSGSPLD